MTHLEHRTADTFDGWWTPQWLLDLVRQMDPIALDPCTEACNPTQARVFYTEGGLEQDWSLPFKGSIWVNPPYGRALGAWSKKMVHEADKHRRVRDMFMLTPARTETEWFGELFDNADAIAFFRKRIKFEHPSQPGKQSPKFPNALFYFGEYVGEFTRTFLDVARVVKLK